MRLSSHSRPAVAAEIVWVNWSMFPEASVAREMGHTILSPLVRVGTTGYGSSPVQRLLPDAPKS